MTLKPPTGANTALPDPELFESVITWGARGDGTTDDTTAFQNAINAAIASKKKLYIPAPSSTYKITSTLSIAPASGNQVSLDIEGDGPFNQITWAGSNNDSIFYTLGLKRCRIAGLQVRLPQDADGIVVFDVDVSASYPSSGLIDWVNCHVSCAGSLTHPVINSIGWRLGHTGTAAASSEESFHTFTNCTVQFAEGSNATGLCYGWLNEHGNGLNNQWIGCAAAYCNTGWSTTSSAGAGDSTGNAGQYFYACGSQYQSTVFNFSHGGQYAIYGGRHELGDKLVTIQGNVAGDLGITLDMAGVGCSSMASGGIMLNTVSAAATISVRGCDFRAPDNVTWTSSLFTLHAGAGKNGMLTLQDSSLSMSADPCYTVSQGTWTVNVKNCTKMTVNGVAGATSTGLVNGVFDERFGPPAAGKLGFFGVTPVVRRSAYTPTNVVTDRSYDANATTTDELADVLGTLIADLQAYGLLQ